MSKVIYNLIDDSFAHDKFIVAGVISSCINWDRECRDINNPYFLSNERVIDILHKSYNKDKTYGIIFESQAIIPNIYSSITSQIDKFKIFFTHSSKILKNNSNSKWIPGGGIWVGGTFGQGEIKIHEKSKFCSLVSSHKESCYLHSFRKHIALQLIHDDRFDIFGLDKWVPIYQTLHDYKFSIVIENFKDELYFTEKLLNCFATGTIPIYYGASKISEKFDIDGILTFDNIQELNTILNSISDDMYYSKMSSIKNNFKECIQYKSMEDYIYNNYLKHETTTI